MERFYLKQFMKTEGSPFCIENMLHIHGLLHSTDQCAKEACQLTTPEESSRYQLSHCFSTNELSLKYTSEKNLLYEKSFCSGISFVLK